MFFLQIKSLIHIDETAAVDFTTGSLVTYVNTVYRTILNNQRTLDLAGQRDSMYPTQHHTQASDPYTEMEVVVAEMSVVFCLDCHDNLTLLYVRSAQIESTVKPTVMRVKDRDRDVRDNRDMNTDALHVNEVEIEVEAEAYAVTRHLHDILSTVKIQLRSTLSHPIPSRNQIQDPDYDSHHGDEIFFQESRARVRVIFSHFDQAGCGLVDTDMLIEGLVRLGGSSLLSFLFPCFFASLILELRFYVYIYWNFYIHF